MKNLKMALTVILLTFGLSIAADAAGTTSVQQPIRVTFAGDLMLDWSLKTSIHKHGVDYPFTQVKPEVSKSDVAIVNLETAVTKRTSMYEKKYNFKSDPEALKGITNAGFDIVSLANNHSMDYQREGLIDTMNALKKYKLPYIGAGSSYTEAYRVKTFNIKGKKLSFLAFSRVLPDFSWVAGSGKAGLANGYDLKLILNNIKRENPKSDYLFVYMHWGIELKKHPEAFQRDWAKKMIDAGADAVIGSHPHVLQGFEFYKNKPIAYSLGNFLFPDYVRGEKAQTGLLHLDLNGEQVKMSFNPYYISKDIIRAQDTATKKKIWKQLESISYGVKIQNGVIK